MPDRSEAIYDSVYERIHSSVLTELEQVESGITNEIASKKNLMTGNVPKELLANGEEPSKHIILQLRRKALAGYKNIKMHLNGFVPDSIKSIIRLDSVSDIQGRSTENQRYSVEQDKAEYEIDAINELLNKPNYELFLNFGGETPNNNSERNYYDNEVVSYQPVYDAVQNKYNDFSRSRKLKLIAGIVLTLVFSAIDWYMIYAVFQASNMTVRTSIVVAILSAIVLDVPPFILGLMVTQRTDIQRVWYLRNDMEDPGFKRTDRIMSHVTRILIFVIMLLFIAYFVLRAILFLGGGDFNYGLHMIIEKDYQFEYIEFNSSDLISAFVPFVTSAGAFAASIMLSFSRADYITAATAVIKTELTNCITSCKEFKADSAGKGQRMTQRIDEDKHAVWVIFGDGGEMPTDNQFFGIVAKGGMKQALPLYEQIYRQESAWLRGRATEMLEFINSQFATIVMNQPAVENFMNPQTDKIVLDYIWVTNADDAQDRNTTDTIAEIRKQVKLLEDRINA